MSFSNKYPRSVFRELQEFPYSKKNRRAIFNSTKDSEDFVQRLKLYKKLPIHGGCVNCITWNDKGNKILSGSDDQHLVITDPFSYEVLNRYRTNHRANIFSAKFLPETCDSGIISCCGDGSILYTDLCRVDETQDCLFNCHSGTTYDVVTVPNDPHVFLSCGEDYTVRSFDLRIKNKCNKVKCKEDVIIECRRAVTALTVNSLLPYQIAIGCADSTARIYDRRMIPGIDSRLSATDAFIKPGLEKKPYRITSLNFSPEGDDLLVSYSSEHVYLFGVRNTKETVYSTESIIDSDDEETDSSSWISRNDRNDPDQPVRRLRLRGDWSDTGPDARPHSNQPATANQSQGGRRVVQGGLIQRMTDVLSRMLNDPATRAALSQGGEPEPSDQVRLEEGLGEYLDINRRRRPSDGTATAPTDDSVHNDSVAVPGDDTVTTNDGNVEPNSRTDGTLASDDIVPNDGSTLTDQNVNSLSDRDTEMLEALVDSSSDDSARHMLIDSQQPDNPREELAENSMNKKETPNSNQAAHSSHTGLFYDDDNMLPVKRAKEESNVDSSSLESAPQHLSCDSYSLLSQNETSQYLPSESQIQSVTDQSSTCFSQSQREANQSLYNDSQSQSKANQSLFNDSQALSDVNQSLNNESQSQNEANQSLYYDSQAQSDVNQSLYNDSQSQSEVNKFLYNDSQFSNVANQSLASNSQSLNMGNQLTNDSLSQSTSDYISQSTSEYISQSTSEHISQSTNEYISQSSQYESGSQSQSIPSTDQSNQLSSQSIVETENQQPGPSNSQGAQEGSRSNPAVCVLRSSDLPDELSTMFNGFKQKYGKKPMVNLVYSMRGSTASTISMSVDDQQASTSTTIQPPLTEPEERGVNNSRPFEEPTPMETEGNITNETSNQVPMESAPSLNQSEASGTSSTPEQNEPSSQPSTSAYTSTRFAVRMEKELCKAIRNARGMSTQDDTVRLKKANIRMTYTGHRNARTMIKESTFWGSNYVMSGSDCGHVFIWTRDTGRLVMTLQADNHVVNCLQPHPTLPILATSGIDYDVKLWTPLATEPYFDYPAAQELMNRNAIMLEETKDTITVPASFMIRMLACLNQLRRGGPRAVRRRRVPDE